jgi:hypothetical protein
LQNALTENLLKKFAMVGCGVAMQSIKVAPKVWASLFIHEIASTVIAGVIVVIVDWKRLLRRAKN